MSYITEYIAGLDKPNCAVSVNGNWLEDLVHGYRTHSVTGRNTSSMEITEVTVGNSNGSRYRRKRDESKDITVSFGITGEDEQAVHKLSELLQKSLNQAESKFIFWDEQDVYYIGTVSGFTEEWQNGAGSDYKTMTGEFTIRCSSPYRNATQLTTVTTNGLKGTNAVQLVNNGTVATPLNIESYMWDGSQLLAYSLDKSDTESLAYILGTPKEVDSTTTTEQATTILDQSFSSDPEWTVNAGILPPITNTTLEQEGTLKFSSGARADDYGDGSEKSWHGPSLSHIVPAVSGKYAQNWRANWAFDFDTGEATDSTSNYYGCQAMTLADGSGNPVVSIVQMDNTANDNTELRCYVGRTKHTIGTIGNNNRHIASGGNITVEKIDSDIHVTYSMPKPAEQNTVRVNKGGSSGTVEVRGTASSNFNSRITCTYYAWFKESEVNTTNNTSTITWAANAVMGGSIQFSGTRRPHAGIVNIWINGQIVCSEHVPLVAWSSGKEVWASGWRTFTVTHDADGSKSVECKIDFDAGTDDVGYGKWYWGDGAPYSTTLTLSKLEKKIVESDNTNGYVTFDKHFTATNPSTTIRQMTWWTAAYGDDWESETDSDGNVTTSGQDRFDNSILRSFKFIKYADTATVAKDNSAYFSVGDTITVDADTNKVKQNGTENSNFVDMTSQPLMLEPGTHTLKVAVDTTTANRPPTMVITYREKWK